MSSALLLLPNLPLNLNNLENLSLHKQIRQVMLIAIICSPDHLLHPAPPHLLLPQMHHRPRPPPLQASQRCPSALHTKGSTLLVSSRKLHFDFSLRPLRLRLPLHLLLLHLRWPHCHLQQTSTWTTVGEQRSTRPFPLLRPQSTPRYICDIHIKIFTFCDETFLIQTLNVD